MATVRRRACAGIQVLLGILCALFGTVAISYIGLFYLGASEVLSVDVAPTWHSPGLLHSQPLLNNTLLLSIFCVCHSVFSRQCVKKLFSSLFMMSPAVYRHFHFFQSSLTLLLICYGWTPQSTAIWDVQYQPIRYSLLGVGVLGVVITTIGFFTLPVLDMFGIQKPLQELTGSREKEIELITSGVYGFIRHPMYTGIILSVWSHPTMTISRLLISVSLLIYLLIAVPWFEERDLVTIFGEKYTQYMKTTPMFFPIHFPSPPVNKDYKGN